MTWFALLIMLVGAGLLYAGVTGTSPVELLTGRKGVPSVKPKPAAARV